MLDLDAVTQNPYALTQGRTFKQILVDVHALLATPERWTQRAFARTVGGDPAKPLDAWATCWCLLGATARVSNPFGLVPPQLMRYLDSLMHELYPGRFETLGAMNDYLDHEGVLAFLREAASRFQQ